MGYQPRSSGAPQTPWAQDIATGGFKLNPPLDSDVVQGGSESGIGKLRILADGTMAIVGSANNDTAAGIDSASHGFIKAGSDGGFFGFDGGGNPIVTGNIIVTGTITATSFNDLALAEDTGWTANADAGDKTAVIPDSAALATLATAMNLAVSGSGTALVAIANKVKALETALASALFPDA